MKSGEALPPELNPGPDTYDVLPGGASIYRIQEDGEALIICFCCGYPLCTDAGDYVEWFEFVRVDECPDPDPHWVMLCARCGYEIEIDNCNVDETYYDGAA